MPSILDRKHRETFFVKILCSLPGYRLNEKEKLFSSKSSSAFLGIHLKSVWFFWGLNKCVCLEMCRVKFGYFNTSIISSDLAYVKPIPAFRLPVEKKLGSLQL